MTVSGTRVETMLLDQPNTSPRPTAIAITAPSVRMIAANVRHERYTIATSVNRKIPNSGMNFLVAVPVCRSSHASSHGFPTRRMAEYAVD